MHMLTRNKKIVVGATLAIIAGIFSVNAWSKGKSPSSEEVVSQNGPTLSKEVISEVSYHEGKRTLALPYLENGVLYLSEIEKHATSTDAEVSRKKVAEGVMRLLGVNKNTGQFLYLTAGKESTSGEDFSGVGLWMSNSTGNTKEVYRGVTTAALSPSGTRIVLSDVEFKIRIIDTEGNMLVTIPGHGSGAVFSPDGMKVAYQMLSVDRREKSTEVMSTELLAQGIMLYDFNSGVGEMVTDDGNDYGPAHFTANGKKLYFMATRFYSDDIGNVNNLHLVDMEAKHKVLRLTNNSGREGSSETPAFSVPDVWSSDKMIAFARTESGIIEFKFNPDGTRKEVKLLPDMSNPQLLEQDKKLILRKKRADGKKYWGSVNIQ